MRARMVGLAFVLGLVAVGVAIAGMNGHWSTHRDRRPRGAGDASPAQAQATFKLSHDGSSLSYKLNVANIENVIQAHIHMAMSGRQRPDRRLVVSELTAGPAHPGTVERNALAKGRSPLEISSGPLAGQPLTALVNAIDAGNAYVNVHTTAVPARGDFGATSRRHGKASGEAGAMCQASRPL